MKKIGIVLTLIFLSFSLSGCKSTPTVVTDPENNRIVWWGIYDEQKDVAKLITKFENDHPEITIDYIKKDKSTYAQELKEVLSDSDPNNTPDIFAVHNSSVTKYSKHIANAPSSVYSVEDFSNDMHSFVAEDLVINDQLKGVPLWVDNLAIVYNPPLLLESGNTIIAEDWIRFKQQATSMTSFNEDELLVGGLSAGNSKNVEHSFEFLNLLFLQSREIPLTAKTRNLPFSKGEESNLNNAISFYKSFNNKTWNSNQEDDGIEFLRGELASLIIPSRKLSEFVKYKNDLKLDLEISTAQVPQLNSSNEQKVNFATYWTYVVSKDSSKVNTTWEFLKLISSKEGYNLYQEAIETNGTNKIALISPRKEMLNDYTEDQLLAPYAQTIEVSTSWNMIDSEAFRPVYENLIDGNGKLEDLSDLLNSIKKEKDKL